MSELVQTIIQIFGTNSRRVKRKAALTLTNMCGWDVGLVEFGVCGGCGVWVCVHHKFGKKL